MTTKDEALKLALEALLGWGKGFPDNWGDLDTEAITAIREALAEQQSGIKQVIELYDSPEQPAQHEPVACKTMCELCVKRGYSFCVNAAQTTPIPSPPASKPEDK